MTDKKWMKFISIFSIIYGLFAITCAILDYPNNPSRSGSGIILGFTGIGVGFFTWKLAKLM